MTSSSRTSGLRRRTTGMLAALLSGVLLLSGCSIYDLPLPGGADAGENPMRIKVLFRDVLDLVPQSTVKVDDVTVGKVKAIKLNGYVAQVTIEVPRSLDMPDNTRAEIRQTSLLGEKFVSLTEPQEPGSGKLSDNDVIGLDRTGRNPEIEEVLGALSLLLNGGGVGQLKTIAAELNNALGGNEAEVRSVLTQIRSFMGQLDQNKESIVAAIENTSRLAVEIRKQDGTIKSALDNVPDTLRSVNRQRDDLVKLLQALTRLSGVGVRVIKASKESTINSLRDLAPVLEGFAKAGDNFAKSFQVFLTYPFVDEAIGRDPQVARNLHMGDFTNLSVNLDLDLAELAVPEGPTVTLPPQLCQAVKDARAEARRLANTLPEGDVRDQVLAAMLAEIGTNCEIGINDVRKYFAGLILGLGTTVANAVCPEAGPVVCDFLANPNAIPPITLPTVPAGGGLGGILPRSAPGKGYQVPEQIDPFGLAAHGLDPGIGTMLLQGVAEVR